MPEPFRAPQARTAFVRHLAAPRTYCEGLIMKQMEEVTKMACRAPRAWTSVLLVGLSLLLATPPSAAQQNIPPKCNIDPPEKVNVIILEDVNFTVTGTDPDSNDWLTITSGDLPLGVTMSPWPAKGASPVSSKLDWTPESAKKGEHTLVFRVTDRAGAWDTCSVEVNVENPPGACCDKLGECTQTPEADCDAALFQGVGVDCTPGLCPRIIPATSEWGLAAMVLIALSAGMVAFRRLRPTRA